MSLKLWLALSALALVTFGTGQAQGSSHDFYQGKTIRFVVGLAPGGGYDLAARTVARHMGKHIPGNPSIVVENMTGAGSLIARTIPTTAPNLTACSSASGTALWSCARRLATKR